MLRLERRGGSSSALIKSSAAGPVSPRAKRRGLFLEEK